MSFDLKISIKVNEGGNGEAKIAGIAGRSRITIVFYKTSRMRKLGVKSASMHGPDAAEQAGRLLVSAGQVLSKREMGRLRRMLAEGST